MQHWKIVHEGPGPTQQLAPDFKKRAGYLVHEASDPHEVLGRQPTNPDAHFTIPREQISFLTGIALDEFPTSADRISDGFGDRLNPGTDYTE